MKLDTTRKYVPTTFQQSSKPEAVFALFTERVVETPSSGWTLEDDTSHSLGANKPYR